MSVAVATKSFTSDGEAETLRQLSRAQAPNTRPPSWTCSCHHWFYNGEMLAAISAYNATLPEEHRAIADALARLISQGLVQAESKIWHRMAVWFITNNPVVGYASRKHHLTLLFWSGQGFNEPALRPEGTFKAAEIHYTDPSQIKQQDIARWLDKAVLRQWDYRNIRQRKGQLEKIGDW